MSGIGGKSKQNIILLCCNTNGLRTKVGAVSDEQKVHTVEIDC